MTVPHSERLRTIFYGAPHDVYHGGDDIHDGDDVSNGDGDAKDTNDDGDDDGDDGKNRSVQMLAAQLKLKRQVKRFF